MSAETPSASAEKTNKSKATCFGKTGYKNAVLVMFCVMCISSSVYHGWRQGYLEDRLRKLEDRVSSMEPRSFDVMASRIRRETLAQVNRRIRRDSYQMKQGGVFGDFVRPTRDAPECICPAGES
ncbi:hypothetical protein HHI36_013054 [Cryptolaemus montrouzieri]|uniref:Uncharacterized protein n=1 Tax=Cryptolaemus montrouzieri TaxID=559131 RepID=A0ABD2NG76_9CUCU